ncbi:MAG TPA: hypothetical protein DCE42_23055 [Myxococcales bacterium]|nr:hypothetical protein [Myxococcales bacterium]
MMRRANLRFGLLFLMVFFASCSSSGLNCSGCASSCGGNPNYQFKGKLLNNGVKARITQPGFDFITKNLKPIIEASLAKSGQKLACSGAGVSIADIIQGNGPQSGGNYVKPNASNCNTRFKLPLNAYCSGSTPNSTWFYAGLKGNNVCGTIQQNSLQIKLDETDNSVNVEFNIPEIQVRSKNPDIGVCVKQNFNATIAKGTACGGATMSLQDVRLRLTNLAGKNKLNFVSDPNTGKIGLKVAPNGVTFGTNTRFEMLVNKCNAVEIHIMRVPVVNYDVKVKLGSSFCTGIVKTITGLVNATKAIQPLIFRALGGVITDQLKNYDLLGVAKVQMELPLAPILGGFGLPGLDKAKPLGMLMQPSNKIGVVRGGLNLGMDAGFESNPASRCVPARPVPNEQPGPEPSLTGSFHLGASLSRAASNQAMWAVYHTGLLCIGLKSSDVNSMSGGGFKLNAGVLALLAPKLTQLVPEEAAVMLQMQPTQAPRIEFGTGKVVNGKTDSTIQLQLTDFGLSFYVMMHDRFVRIFKLLVDLRLGMTLAPTPGNKLEVVIDTDTLVLRNARIEQANLVNTTDVNQLLPTLVSLLTSTLGNKKISFDVDLSDQLTKALGVPITVRINGIERDGVARDWLSLKMTMSNGSQPQLPRPMTVARVAQNPGLVKQVKGKMLPTGEVFLDVPEMLAGQKLEYQYYVDFGAWSNYHTAPNGRLRVRDPKLNMLGQHTVWLRARIKGDYTTLEEVPASVTFTFDPVAPTVRIAQNKHAIRIDAADAVSVKEKLTYEVYSKGQWRALNDRYVMLDKQKSDTVRIRVTDENGNKRFVDYSVGQKKVISTTEDSIGTGTIPPRGGWLCSMSDGEDQPLPFAFFFILVALPLFWRRLR